MQYHKGNYYRASLNYDFSRLATEKSYIKAVTIERGRFKLLIDKDKS